MSVGLRWDYAATLARRSCSPTFQRSVSRDEDIIHLAVSVIAPTPPEEEQLPNSDRQNHGTGARVEFKRGARQKATRCNLRPSLRDPGSLHGEGATGPQSTVPGGIRRLGRRADSAAPLGIGGRAHYGREVRKFGDREYAMSGIKAR